MVLTKLDGDARGGAALSIAALTGKPVMFASTGEKLSDFDVFHPDRMATRILDMGDVLSLIERAEKAFDAEQTASIAERMMSGEGFTLEDFVEQLNMLRKLGPLKNILGMMPGASKNKALLDQVNDKDLDRAEAIVRSMTPQERRTPKIINGSRRLRIANGSGVTVGEVSQLVTNFFEGQKQMKMLMGGGMPGMPAIPGMAARRPALGQGRQAAKNAKGKRRSGDPRKAAIGPAGGSGNGAGAPGAARRRRGPGRAAVDGGAGRDAPRGPGGRRPGRPGRRGRLPRLRRPRPGWPAPRCRVRAPTSSPPPSASATRRRSNSAAGQIRKVARQRPRPGDARRISAPTTIHPPPYRAAGRREREDFLLSFGVRNSRYTSAVTS